MKVYYSLKLHTHPFGALIEESMVTDLRSERGGRRWLQLRIQIPVSEKTPSQLLPEADCITVLRKCKSSRDAEAIHQLTRKHARVSFAFGKILMGKLERITLRMTAGYSNVEA